MTPRERQLAVIGRRTQICSIDCISVENKPQIAAHLGVSEDDVAGALGIDGRITGPVYVPPPDSPFGDSKHPFGVYQSEYGSTHDYPFNADSNLSAVESYFWPKTADFDYGAMRLKALALGEKYAVRGPSWNPVFCMVCMLMGMEQTLIGMAEGSVAFEAVLEHVSSFYLEHTERMLDECGAALDIYCFGDDFATQRGMLFSPSLWRKYLKPVYARQFGAAKRAGKPVWFHSCGDISAILPDLIDIGMDVWETVQLHTLPIAPERLKAEYGGHITFFGGINTQRLPFMTPEEIRQEVRRVADVLGKGGGYIIGPDHHIKPDVSVQNTLALFEEAQKYTR